jgi:hypothetical protein
VPCSKRSTASQGIPCGSALHPMTLRADMCSRASQPSGPRSRAVTRCGGCRVASTSVGIIGGLTTLAGNGEQMRARAEEAHFVLHQLGRAEDVRALLWVIPPIANEFPWSFDADERLED